MTIRIGFYGAGLISRMHCSFLSTTSVPNAITAVHDPSAERAAGFARATGATVLGEDELLNEVDAVYVTTWTAEHPRLVAKAAERGVAVFCEKPLAVSATVAQEMVDVVEKAGVVNQVGLILRSVPQYVHLRHLIEDDRAGRPMAVVFRDDQYIPNQGRYASTWRVDPERSGRGALLEHSIHDVDVLQWLFGSVASVNATIREVHGHVRIDDVAVARMEFESGAIASLTSIWHDILERPSMRHVEVFSERLYACVEGGADGRLRWQFTGSEEHVLEGDELVAACHGSPLLSTGETTAFLGGTVFNPASAFLTAVRDGGPSPLPFREAIQAHRLVDAMYASADAGGVSMTGILGSFDAGLA